MTDLPATPPFALVAVDACTGSPLASRPWQTGDPQPPTIRVVKPGPALEREGTHRAAIARAVDDGDDDALVALADAVNDDDAVHWMDRQRVAGVLHGMADAMDAEGLAH